MCTRCLGTHHWRAQCHGDEGGYGVGKHRMGLTCQGANRLWIEHVLSRCIVAVRGNAACNSMRRIAGALVQALTMLLEPAMQHVGIHAMFTRRGGNRCAGLLACGDQFSLEWRAVDPASAWGAGARIGNLLRPGVHDGLRGHDGACNCSIGVDGLAGRIPSTNQPNQPDKTLVLCTTMFCMSLGALQRSPLAPQAPPLAPR